MVDHAIFSKDGPNLNNPAETNRPSVIPNKYRLKKRNPKEDHELEWINEKFISGLSFEG